MTSRKRPRLPPLGDHIYCAVCKIEFNNQLCLEIHRRGADHKQTVKNPQTAKREDLLEEAFYDPGKKVSLIGLQYVSKGISKKGNPFYSCTLCMHYDLFHSVLAHLGNLKHKLNYIGKHFPFLSKHVKGKPLVFVEKIAKVIEVVEGFTRYKTDVPRERQQGPLASTPADNSEQNVIDEVLEKLAERGMRFENPDKSMNSRSPGLGSSGSVHNEHSKRLKIISTTGANDPASAMQNRACERSQFSLSRAAPVSSSLGYQTGERGSYSPRAQNTSSSKAAGGYVLQNNGKVQEYTPADDGSFPSTPPFHYQSFPSTVTGGPSYPYLNYGYGAQALQTHHGYTQTIPDVVQRQESTRTNVKDLLNVEPICHSSALFTCPSGQSSNGYAEGCSYYGGGSQATDSSTTGTTHSGLSPDILEILRGKDVPTVTYILTRLADYCPPLQQVNISMLAGVLFESGAID